MKADRPKRRTLQPPVPLPVGTRLGRYEVRNVLGSGAFGVVYRVLDADTDEELAVREYLPTHLAQRDGATQVVLRSPDDAEVFAAGLRFFVNEGKLLPKFDHPSLVKVHDAWEANGTAYMAMALVAGRTLADTHLTRWKAPRESPRCAPCWTRCWARWSRCTRPGCSTATSRRRPSWWRWTAAPCCWTWARRAA
jgi:hypothetical protein